MDSSSTTQTVVRRLAHAAREGLRHASYDVLFPLVYRLGTLRPADPAKALFVETTTTQPSHSERPMYDYLVARGMTCAFVSLGKYRLSTLAHLRQCCVVSYRAATAGTVFLCEACPPVASLPLRRQTRVVQLWHGCGAFKRFGMSTADKIFGASRADKLRHPEHANTSLVTVSSPEVVWAYEEAMGLEGRGVVRPLGISRTDMFFDKKTLRAWRAHALESVPAAHGKKVLLYAPTFRGHVKEATSPEALDIALLRERLGGEWFVMVKHHPHVRRRPTVPPDLADFVADVSQTLSIEEAMAAADALVTDYSSLVFEYSLLGRPMAFFAFDKDDYDDWRGFYYDYDHMTPGPVFTASEQVAQWVMDLPQGFDAARVEAFRERFMSACDGHATERIAAWALGEGTL